LKKKIPLKKIKFFWIIQKVGTNTNIVLNPGLEDEFEGELCEIAIGGFGPVIPGNGGSSSIVVLTVVGAIVGLLGIVGVGVVRVSKVESLKKDMKSKTKNSAKEHCGKSVRKIEKSSGSGGRGRKRKRKVRGAGKK